MKYPKMSLSEYCIALLFAVIILVVAAQVVCRSLFNNSLTWTEELSRYLFTWIIFLGAALALKDNSHIRIDFITNRFPTRTKKAIEIMNLVLIFAFLTLISILGFMLVRRTENTQSPALSLPVNYVFYAALPVTSLLGVYYLIRKFAITLREWKKQEIEDK